MKIVIYSAKNSEKFYFDAVNQKHTLTFIAEELSVNTIQHAKSYDGVCCFVTDCLDSDIIIQLSKMGIQLLALRSTGYDHVDMSAAKLTGMTVVHVPKYSPEAIAEFAVGLILVLSRKIVTSYLQGLKYNFSLENLMGFNLNQKTIGIIGTGSIGSAFARIMKGFGCRLLAVDPVPNDQCRRLGVAYVSLDHLLQKSDIISLHCLLNEKTTHIMNKKAFERMKKGAMLINTGRGGLCDTKALIQALETGKLGYVGLDVYEKEHGLFFINHHGEAIRDKQFLKLQSFPNVIITPHQAFYTEEAMINIAKITLENITAFEQGHTINQIF